MSKKEKAFVLRKENKSYREISEALNIPKSTLSNWLSRYPLPKEIIKKLRDNNPERIKKYQQTMAAKRQLVMSELKQKAFADLNPLSPKELFVAGLFLYWGEGGKTANWRISLSNSDPAMIKFFILWARKCFKVKMDDFRVLIHLYSDMDIKKELEFWSKKLDIPHSQFFNPYIKKSSINSISHINCYTHGTCNISVNNANIARRVLASLEAAKSILPGV